MDRASRLHVTVVAHNPETLASLQEYLGGAGVTTAGQTDLAHLCVTMPAESTVAVVFPDDFMFLAVAAELEALRRGRADVLVVLVTSDPRRFEALPHLEVGHEPVVIPKPAWGFTILETIRARLAEGPPA